eukprot:7185150-Pyramimonas_sp.AAC.1
MSLALGQPPGSLRDGGPSRSRAGATGLGDVGVRIIFEKPISPGKGTGAIFSRVASGHHGR